MADKLKPVVLTILDGWGYSPATEGNAIAAARKPTYDHLLRTYPNSLIYTSGTSVGLPDGQMGNSEVGPHEYGRGPRRLYGRYAHRPDDQFRRILPESGSAECDAKSRGSPVSISWACAATAACMRS